VNKNIKKSFYCNLIVVLIFFSIFSPFLSYGSWLPDVSLKPSGSIYFGKYTGNSERYNLDAGVDVSVSLLSWERTDFFVEYISNLEMAKQVGNVTFDPRYAHYFINGGFKVEKCGYVFKSYLVHDCKHIIDFPPDSNKVVFNRLKFSVSRNLNGFVDRFQIRQVQKSRKRRPRWQFIYGFYPQSKVIDYLNSKSYYRHDFEGKLEFPILFLSKAELFSGLRGRYVVSANHPARYYRELSFLLEAVWFNENGALSFYIENIPLDNDPLKSPEGLSIIGMHYYF